MQPFTLLATSSIGRLLLTFIISFSFAKASLAQDSDEGPSETLTKILNAQVEAWNRGDIDSFMKAYWKSDKLTFSSGGQTTRGWEATRKRYHLRYPNKEQMGQLRFSELEVQALGRDAALVLGRWALKREEPVGGNFSLVWRRVRGKWVIIHDHSSAEE